MCPRQSRQQQLVGAQLCAHKIAQEQQKAKEKERDYKVPSIVSLTYITFALNEINKVFKTKCFVSLCDLAQVLRLSSNLSKGLQSHLSILHFSK